MLTLLLQVACAAALLSAEGGWLALWSAVLVARLAMVRTGLPGVAVAAGSSLGRAVAGTVPRAWWVAASCCSARASWPAAGCSSTAWPGLSRCWRPPPRDCSRPRGCTAAPRPASAGPPATSMGAMGEVAMTAHLLAAAALWG